MEEIEYAKQQGIQQIAVISGISSAIAGPAAAGIPVTSRGLSTSFWVLTATTKEGELAPDIQMAAQSTATVVLLMGIRKIEAIAALFSQFRDATTPIAIIQNATLENQHTVVDQLSGVGGRLAEIDVQAPGIIVIGEVVRMAELNFSDAEDINCHVLQRVD